MMGVGSAITELEATGVEDSIIAKIANRVISSMYDFIVFEQYAQDTKAHPICGQYQPISELLVEDAPGVLSAMFEGSFVEPSMWQQTTY